MKHLAWLVLFTSFSSCVLCQNTFNHQYDLDYQFKVLTSVLPTDSCYYVTGLVTDTADMSYRLGLLFLKLDLNGEIVTEKKLSANGTWYQPWRGDLFADENGNLLNVGDKSDSVESVFLVKLNTQGDTLFTKTYFNPLYPDDDFIRAAMIRRKPNGNMYILCGIDNDPTAANPDINIIEVDSAGGVVNSFVYGEEGVTEIPFSLIADDDGGAIIGSNKSNSGFVSENFYSRTHVFGIDSTGEVEWEFVTTPAGLYDTARDMLRTPDGGVIVATGKGIEHAVNPSSGILLWFPYIFKLNENHQWVWGREFRGTNRSIEFSFVKVIPAIDGSGYVAVGAIAEDISVGEEKLGSWIVKVSPQGDSLWARYYTFFDSIQASPRPKDLKNTPDGGYVIVGETKPQLPAGQAQRAWIMKVDGYGCLIPGCQEGDTVSTATVLPVQPKIDIAIYPNPTSDYLNFQLRTAQVMSSATFRITDAGGRTIKEVESHLPKETHIIPVHGWASGVYFLQYMKDGQVLVSERFVVGR